MSRERLTERKAEILKALDTLKRLAVEDTGIADEAAPAQNDEVKKEADAIEKKDVAAIGKVDADADLKAKADVITKEEHKEVTQSLTTGYTPKDEGDQNAKSNANWPLTDAEREKVATDLLTLAEQLVG